MKGFAMGLLFAMTFIAAADHDRLKTVPACGETYGYGLSVFTFFFIGFLLLVGYLAGKGDASKTMSATFSTACHRLSAQKPYLKWSEVCRMVSQSMRREVAPKVSPNEIRLPYKD